MPHMKLCRKQGIFARSCPKMTRLCKKFAIYFVAHSSGPAPRASSHVSVLVSVVVLLLFAVARGGHGQSWRAATALFTFGQHLVVGPRPAGREFLFLALCLGFVGAAAAATHGHGGDGRRLWPPCCDRPGPAVDNLVHEWSLEFLSPNANRRRGRRANFMRQTSLKAEIIAAVTINGRSRPL